MLVIKLNMKHDLPVANQDSAARLADSTRNFLPSDSSDQGAKSRKKINEADIL